MKFGRYIDNPNIIICSTNCIEDKFQIPNQIFNYSKSESKYFCENNN